MKDFRNYWLSIKDSIDNQHFINACSSWSKTDIQLFREHMFMVLVEKFHQDKRKAVLVNYRGDESKADDLYIIKVKAFREIFRGKKSSGKPFTRDLFAIYLGYDSHLDYIRKNQIESKEKVANNKFDIVYTSRAFSFFANRKYKNGKLTLADDHLQLEFQDASVKIEGLESIANFRMSGDFAQNWVQLEFIQDDQVSEYFIRKKEGIALGAITGGSKDLYRQLRQFLTRK